MIVAWCAALLLVINLTADASMVVHNCDHPPSVWMNKYAREFDSVPGFKFRHVKVIRDVRYNKTLFMSVLLEKSLMRDTSPDCGLYRRDVGAYPPYLVGYIVPHRFGGSCEAANLYPQNMVCLMNEWLTFEHWLKWDVRRNDLVKYCMELSYDSAKERVPYMIVARAYSYPDNEYLRSISINNPFLDECESLEHAV